MAIRVLVVDDSALMRKQLSTLLSEAGFEVALARNGREAVDQVIALQPDVVTLDINMPEMDGLTALSLIMAARPTPVVMVSSLTTQGAMATLEALAMGAVDYIAKPGGTVSLSLGEMAEELVAKVKVAARAKLRSRSRVPLSEKLREDRESIVRRAPRPTLRTGFGLVLVGVSTGGPRTLEEILPELPADFPWPVLVAQHMPANFTTALAARMDRLCALSVREVGRPEPLEPGVIYLGRGGTDLTVGNRAGRLMALPKPETPGYPWHPSVDVLVESALAHVKATELIGVLLTGMGYDGAESMAKIKEGGGRTIAESEDTAVVFGMPMELINRGGASMVLPAPRVAAQLVRWTQEGSG